MAVPYEACDCPNERSEFKQPDVAIILTFLTYYQAGMTREQVREVMGKLAAIGMEHPKARDRLYRCDALRSCMWGQPAGKGSRSLQAAETL